MRLVFGLVLIGHGLITGTVWATPPHVEPVPAFGRESSVLLAEMSPTVVSLAMLSAIAFVCAGAALVLKLECWACMGVVGALLSLGLLTATFSPWWSAAILVNVATVVVAWRTALSEVTGQPVTR